MNFKFFCDVAAGALCFLLASCASAPRPADLFIIREYSPTEKADILVRKGMALYNDSLLRRNDYPEVPRIRAYFTNALALDPGSEEASEYLSRVDAFRADHLAASLSRARRLADRQSRTAAEDYELCLAVQEALELEPANAEAHRLRDATSACRTRVLGDRLDATAKALPALEREKNPVARAKLVVKTAATLAEVVRLDAGNREAAADRARLDDIVSGFLKTDLDAARASLDRKDYAAARTAADHALRTLDGMSVEPDTETADLSYRISYEWARDLLARNRPESASLRVSEALAVRTTREALELKDRIAKSRAVRDYDAELADILADIDARLSSGDLSGAAGLITATLGKVRQQGSRDKLAARKANLADRVRVAYAAAVTAYNSEDYGDARKGFRTVVGVDPGYEQAKAYLDRTENKLQALNGAN